VSRKSEKTQTESLKLLISQDAILKKIAQFSKQIDVDYSDKDLVFLMVMKGAICLVADLIRHIHIPCAVDFVHASSYGMKGSRPGELEIFGIEKLNVSNKDVIVVDDIFDTGNTLSTIVERLKGMRPKSVKSLVLLSKNVSRKTSYEPDFSLFEIDDLFVVGYGLDYKENFRGLPGIYVLNIDNLE
jgi:hypoxanthine phosphoribosyltransferase